MFFRTKKSGTRSYLQVVEDLENDKRGWLYILGAECGRSVRSGTN